MRDMDDGFWFAVIFATLASMIIFLVFADRRQERFMAEKGYCYQSVDRVGNPPNWQYQKCK